jgi:hypothetical protein
MVGLEKKMMMVYGTEYHTIPYHVSTYSYIHKKKCKTLTRYEYGTSTGKQKPVVRAQSCANRETINNNLLQQRNQPYLQRQGQDHQQLVQTHHTQEQQWNQEKQHLTSQLQAMQRQIDTLTTEKAELPQMLYSKANAELQLKDVQEEFQKKEKELEMERGKLEVYEKFQMQQQQQQQQQQHTPTASGTPPTVTPPTEKPIVAVTGGAVEKSSGTESTKSGGGEKSSSTPTPTAKDGVESPETDGEMSTTLTVEKKSRREPPTVVPVVVRRMAKNPRPNKPRRQPMTPRVVVKVRRADRKLPPYVRD